MEIGTVTIGGAFLAGMLSFVSPCVLPMLPTFSAVLAGAVSERDEENSGRLYGNALCFLLGFTLVFVLMGATASLLGEWFFDHQPEIRKIGAVLIIVMGLTLSGIWRIGALEREYRPLLLRTFQGPLGAFLLGMSFTVGWTPCTGPILAAILLYAGGTATVGMGALLLLIYSLGFAIPFFLFVVVLRRSLNKVRSVYQYLPAIQRFAGYLLIVLGVMLWLDWLAKGIGVLWSIFQ